MTCFYGYEIKNLNVFVFPSQMKTSSKVSVYSHQLWSILKGTDSPPFFMLKELTTKILIGHIKKI